MPSTITVSRLNQRIMGMNSPLCNCPEEGHYVDCPRGMCDCPYVHPRHTMTYQRLWSDPLQRRKPSKCGCECNCHVDEDKPEWPGPCGGCCDPELTTYDCKCAAYMRGYFAGQQLTKHYEAGCVPSGNADARSIGLDWCRVHDRRWVLDYPVCDGVVPSNE